MKQIKYPKLVKRLKELRKAHAYRQEDVAAALGIVRQTYANYEQGIRTPDAEVLYKLAGFYNIPVDDLMHLTMELDPDEYFDAPSPSQSSLILSDYIAYFNEPENVKRFRTFDNSERELIYYFEKLSENDKKEIIESAKMKVKDRPAE